MKSRIMRLGLICTGLLAAAQSTPVLACAVCFGKSDSALAKGLHWGVISLLAVVLSVLAAIAVFFVYLAKRSASVTENSVSATQRVAATTHKV
jgi:hypothetical protein